MTLNIYFLKRHYLELHPRYDARSNYNIFSKERSFYLVEFAIGAINIVFVAVYAADALRWTLRRGQQPPREKRQHHAEDCIAGQHLASLAETKHKKQCIHQISWEEKNLRSLSKFKKYMVAYTNWAGCVINVQFQLKA
jgi:hypothetical protein